MEARAHYDFETTDKNPDGPGFFRRLAFVCALGFLAGYLYERAYPDDFHEKTRLLECYLEKCLKALNVGRLDKHSIPLIADH